MNQVVSFLRRSAQTQHTVKDRTQETQQRMQSIRVAYRLMVCVQMLAQLLLWIVLWLYGDVSLTTWQALFLQVLPGLGLWAVWSGLPQRTPSLAALRLRLLLLPCLLLDGCVLLMSLSLFCQLQLPSWPSHVVSLGLAALLFMTLLFSGQHGVAFGINQIRSFLLVLFVGVVFMDVKPDPDHLWPFWGEGPLVTLLSALAGVGNAWGVSLLFSMPREASPLPTPEKRSSTLPWTLLPILLASLWALWLCLCSTWQPANHLLPKEKMIVLTWRSSDLLSFQFSIVFWMVLLVAALAGNGSSALHLLDEAIPRCPKALAIALYLLPFLVFSFFPAEGALAFLQILLPFRFLLSLGVGLATLLLERKRPA